MILLKTSLYKADCKNVSVLASHTKNLIKKLHVSRLSTKSHTVLKQVLGYGYAGFSTLEQIYTDMLRLLATSRNGLTVHVVHRAETKYT